MVRVLEHQSHPASELFQIIVIIINVLSVHINMAVRCFQKTVQKLDKGGFTGTGLPDNPDKLPFPDLQVYIFQRLSFMYRTAAVCKTNFIQNN